MSWALVPLFFSYSQVSGVLLRPASFLVGIFLGGVGVSVDLAIPTGPFSEPHIQWREKKVQFLDLSLIDLDRTDLGHVLSFEPITVDSMLVEYADRMILDYMLPSQMEPGLVFFMRTIK